MIKLAYLTCIVSILISCGKQETINEKKASKDKSIDDTVYVTKSSVECSGLDLITANDSALQTQIDIEHEKSIHASNFYIQDYDIQLPEQLSKEVLNDIRNKTFTNGKISPKTFWDTLSPNLAEKLNTRLIDQYIFLDESGFREKQAKVAYAFIYLIENGDIDQGIQLFDKNSDGFERGFGVSFSNHCRSNLKVRICDPKQLKIKRPQGTLIPSDIKTRVHCSNEEGQTLNFDSTNEAEVTISLYNAKDEFYYSQVFKNTDFEVRENNKWKKVDYSDEDLSIKMKIRKWGNNRIDYINFQMNDTNTGRTRFNLLECDEFKGKPLNF